MNNRTLRLRSYGFTLVELLIVIVVIAILAAISVVAYNGIQDRAHESAVQSDLRNMAMKAREFSLTDASAQPPQANQADLEAIVKVSKQSYNQRNSGASLVYCRNNEHFAFVASSKAGTTYVYKSTGGNVQTGGNWGGGSISGTCTNANTTNDPQFSSANGGTFIGLKGTDGAWLSWID